MPDSMLKFSEFINEQPSICLLIYFNIITIENQIFSITIKTYK